MRPFRGFTLIEMIVVVLIVSVLASAAMPLAALHKQRTREHELREGLRTLRAAIDRYKAAVDEGKIEKRDGDSGYPPSLEVLVAGVVVKDDAAGAKPSGGAPGGAAGAVGGAPGAPLASSNMAANAALGAVANGATGVGNNAANSAAGAGARNTAGNGLGKFDLGFASAGSSNSAGGKRLYFLRRLPRDPFADPSLPAAQTWGLRSYASPPDAPAPGADVFDVHSRTDGVGLDGTPYRSW